MFRYLCGTLWITDARHIRLIPTYKKDTGMSENPRKAPVRTARVELTGDYEGWWFDARINPRMSTFTLVTSGEIDKLIDGLAQLLMAWNYVDEEGDPLPQPYNNAEAVSLLSTDLFNKTSEAYVAKVTSLGPN